jgi:hypothetical protein
MKMKPTTLDAIRAEYTAEMLLRRTIESAHGDEKKLRKALEKVVAKVQAMPLQKMITPHLNYGPRYDNYFNSTWALKRIPLSECGVWPKMGGLPPAATYGTVLDTAKYIRPYLTSKKRMVAKMKKAVYIQKLGAFAELITEYVPIVVFEGSIIRHHKLSSAASRKPYKHCKYDIDDGSHRAVALALQGKTQILALVGKRTIKSDLLFF